MVEVLMVGVLALVMMVEGVGGGVDVIFWGGIGIVGGVVRKSVDVDVDGVGFGGVGCVSPNL